MRIPTCRGAVAALLLAAALFPAACSEDRRNSEAPPSADTTQEQPPATDSLTRAQAAQDSAARLEAAIATADRYWDDLARYLAGMSSRSGSTLAELQARESFHRHQEWWAQAWARKERRLLTPLAAWADTALAAERAAGRTVYYPFSGADYVTIHTLYPRSQRYVLFGLEPEGVVPDVRRLNPEHMEAALRNLQKALDDIMVLSFFKTNDMREDLRRTELTGTAPLLLAFMARTGHRVLSVRHVQVQDGGRLAVLDSAPRRPSPTAKHISGLQFEFVHEASGIRKVLQYFSIDVSNQFVDRQEAFQAYLRSLAPTNTYIKSASYLMHNAYFSTIRGLSLDISQSLLQDDSGMPLKAFDPATWQLTFYGGYRRPIGLFAGRYQPELRAAYAKDSSIRKLGFIIGYGNDPSNLMRARKRD